MIGKEYTTSESTPNARYYPPDAIVIQEEDPDDGAVYILEKGKLGVFEGGEMVSEISETGTIISEMAPILNTTRTATIRTITECKLTVYSGNLRKHITEMLPSIAQNLVMAITRRVQDQTIRHADNLLRIENLEKLNQQLRKQVEELKKTQTNPTAGKKKSGGLLHRS